MATRIYADQNKVQEEILLQSAKLDYLQSLVGGRVEFVRFRDGSALMVHEEGRVIGFPTNRVATGLCLAKGRTVEVEHPIVGDAVFLSATEWRWLEAEDAES